MSVATQSAGLKVRALPPDEWERVAHKYPDGVPPAVMILVVEDGDEIVGSADLCLLPFVGLVHIEESRQGDGVGALLAEAIHGLCKEGDSLFTVVTNPVTAGMCERRGWEKVEGDIWRLEV